MNKLKLAAVLWILSLVNFSLESASAEQYDCYASDCNYCPNRDVFLSCPECSFDFEFKALYLQPTTSNLHYGAEADPLPAPTPNWKIHDIDPDYHFGFEVGASTVIPGRNAKAKVNWTHFYSKDSATTVLPSSDMIGPFFEIGPDASPYSKAKGHNVFRYDAVDVDYGLCINFGDYLHTNFFAGVEVSRIHQDRTSFYSNPDKTIFRTIKAPSQFLGAGPQLGMDFAYGICNGLQLTGGGAASLLVGDMKNHTNYESVSPALIPLGINPPNSQGTHGKHRTQLVPAFEVKLGVAYSFALCDFTVNLEAGYQALVYINALQSVDIGSEVVTPPVTPDTVGVYARTFQRNLSNFALAGPYVSVNIGF